MSQSKQWSVQQVRSDRTRSIRAALALAPAGLACVGGGEKLLTAVQPHPVPVPDERHLVAECEADHHLAGIGSIPALRLTDTLLHLLLSRLVSARCVNCAAVGSDGPSGLPDALEGDGGKAAHALVVEDEDSELEGLRWRFL